MKRRYLLFGGALAVGGLTWKLWANPSSSYSVAPNDIANLTNSNQGLPQSQAISSGSLLPRPPINDAPKLRFIMVADTGMGDANQYAVAKAIEKIYAQNPFPLALLGGDNIYPIGEINRIVDVFEKPYQSLLANNVEFRAALGNHDIISDNGIAELAYDKFHMNGRFYQFNYGDVDFFALDTNDNADWRAQFPWLKQVLAQSKASCKIAFGHHPFYSSGAHGGNADFVKFIAPLFTEYGVQMYFCGHDHNYERFAPMGGTTYIVNGGGGAGLRPVGSSAKTVISVARHGFCLVEVYADQILLEAIGTDAEVFDRAIIPIKKAVPV
ncbi:MAG: metallophosphoesterase [Pseudanabaena sp. ELA607]